MSTPNRILDSGVTARLGRQNRVLRHLRTLGVPVLATGLDDELTLVIAAVDGRRLRQQASCVTSRRADAGELFSIHIDGCRVAWLETLIPDESTTNRQRSKP
ncbi:MAG: hypothetical protein ACN6N0_09135 [Microvirgula sp.]